MPTFITLIDLTKQGAHAFEASPKRADAVAKRAFDRGEFEEIVAKMK